MPFAERLYGLVESTEGQFEGFIQWDVSECLSIDTLDGRLNGKNHDFPMGEIRSIARAHKQNASVIVRKDGSTATMGGSNDVESGNRGIMVENPAWEPAGTIPLEKRPSLTDVADAVLYLLKADSITGISAYVADVRSGSFPDDSESYHIADDQIEALGLYGG